MKIKEENINELVEMAVNKNQTAVETLYNMTHNHAYFIAKQIVKSDDEVMDILQEAYIVAFSKLDRLNDKNKFIPWFYQIVGNKCKDYLRKKKPILFSDMYEDDDEREIEFQDFGTHALVEEQIDYKETKRIITEILNHISEEQRICVLMYYFNELSVREIAGSLDCSENTVKSRLNYARKYIKDEIEKEEKKSGVKLHVFTLPTFILALHMIAEDNVMTNTYSITLFQQILKGTKSVGIVGLYIKSKLNTIKNLIHKAERVFKTISKTTVHKTVMVSFGVAALGITIPWLFKGNDKIDDSVIRASLYSGIIQIEDKVIELPNEYSTLAKSDIKSINKLPDDWTAANGEHVISSVLPNENLKYHNTIFGSTLFISTDKKEDGNNPIVLKIKAEKSSKRIYFPKGIHVGSSKKEIDELWGEPTTIDNSDGNSFIEYTYLSEGDINKKNLSNDMENNGTGKINVIISKKTKLIVSIEYKPESFSYSKYIICGENFTIGSDNSNDEQEYKVTYELPYSLSQAYSQKYDTELYIVKAGGRDFGITKSKSSYSSGEVITYEETETIEMNSFMDEPKISNHQVSEKLEKEKELSSGYEIIEEVSGNQFTVNYKVGESTETLLFKVFPFDNNQTISVEAKKALREVVNHFVQTLTIEKIK